MATLSGKKEAILAAEGFEQAELTEPRKTDLVNAGAMWVDREVCVDHGLVSSRKPDDIPAFNQQMIAAFAGAREEGGAAAAG
jgi:deglycase